MNPWVSFVLGIVFAYLLEAGVFYLLDWQEHAPAEIPAGRR